MSAERPRTLVIGASGLVGGALLRALGNSGVGTFHTRPAPGLVQLDARLDGAVGRLIEERGADLVLFPAADPNVEWCEEHPEEAHERNVAPALAALGAARASGAHFVFFSSDYVFDGNAGPYDEGAAPRPISVYGRHKLEVEEAVTAKDGTVIRTTHVFGSEAPPGKNFALRLVASLRRGERVRAPSDQVSTPTWSDELARGTLAVAREPGIWNVAGPDLLSRDELARRIARAFGLDPSLVHPVATSALGQKAARPLRGGLRTEKVAARLDAPLLPVDECLARFRQQLGPP